MPTYRSPKTGVTGGVVGDRKRHNCFSRVRFPNLDIGFEAGRENSQSVRAVHGARCTIPRCRTYKPLPWMCAPWAAGRVQGTLIVWNREVQFTRIRVPDLHDRSALVTRCR